MCDLSVSFVTFLYNTVFKSCDSIKLLKYQKAPDGRSVGCFLAYEQSKGCGDMGKLQERFLIPTIFGI